MSSKEFEDGAGAKGPSRISGLAALAALVAVALGCTTLDPVTRERGGAGLFGRVPIVEGPEEDRCLEHGPGMEAACRQARELGQVYVRRLSTGDPVCMEGGFGEPPRGACGARASVADVGVGTVLIEIRDASPSSAWFDRIAHQVWYTEEALVELYLEENGY